MSWLPLLLAFTAGLLLGAAYRRVAAVCRVVCLRRNFQPAVLRSYQPARSAYQNRAE